MCGLEAVSTTFGTPSPNVLRRLDALGMLLFDTVTSAHEVSVAVAAEADGLVVQGPEVGDHQGTFAPDRNPVRSRSASCWLVSAPPIRYRSSPPRHPEIDYMTSPIRRAAATVEDRMG